MIIAVYRHYGHIGAADFVVQLLNVILRNQFAQHRGEFIQAFGIDTGLPPGIFLANIYLNEVDILVMQTHANTVALCVGLVDDSVVCAADIDAIRSTQNSFGKLLQTVAAHFSMSLLSRSFALSHDAGKLT